MKYNSVSLVLALSIAAGTATQTRAARPVSTKAECRAACGGQTADLCAGLRRGKLRRCEARLLTQCRKHGAAALCPPPTTTTTTTLPLLIVPTTTLPSPAPTTTTTLPPPAVADFRDDYQFDGRITSSSCPDLGIGMPLTLPFSVSTQYQYEIDSIELLGTIVYGGVSRQSLSGVYTTSDGLRLSAGFCEDQVEHCGPPVCTGGTCTTECSVEGVDCHQIGMRASAIGAATELTLGFDARPTGPLDTTHDCAAGAEGVITRR